MFLELCEIVMAAVTNPCGHRQHTVGSFMPKAASTPHCARMRWSLVKKGHALSLAAVLSISILGAALAAPASASAATLQVCRTKSLTSGYDPIVPTEWRCDPTAPDKAAYATSNMYIPARDGRPEVDGFVWLYKSDTYFSPYATIVKLSEDSQYGVLSAWLPQGNGNLTEMRCWRFAGEGIQVEVQPNECAAHIGNAL
jgi:hypothetical protein